MKAIVYTQYGGPEELKLQEIPIPQPKDNEVLIKIFAVSINDWDWALLQGDFINRMLNGFFKPKRKILGSDIAGVVDAVGKDVKKFKPGDEVFGDLSGTWGGFAEYVCANENTLALKAKSMSFEEAAAIPQAAMLAVQGLIDNGKIQAGQKILINGAGGGVGTFGLQIAKLYGVDVTVVDKHEKLEMLHALGATHTIDYRKDDFTRRSERYDLILDVKTNRSTFDYLRVLTPHGRYATVGGHIGRLLQTLLVGGLLSIASTKKAIIVALHTNKDLAYMNELYEAGKVKAIIDGHYKLEDIPEAMRYFIKALHKGKVVITVRTDI